MPESPKAPAELLAAPLTKLAFELNFVEPGKDAGLLPINSFILEAEDIIRGQPVPPELAQAMRQARLWIDQIFDTTATFDPVSIARLGEWQAWMSSALKCWQSQQPCPALPPAWSGAGAAPATARSESGAEASLPASPGATAVEMDSDTEPVLTLSLDADGEFLTSSNVSFKGKSFSLPSSNEEMAGVE